MIAVIDYGASNLRSVQKAFLSMGKDCEVTGNEQSIMNASHVVLPGVGAFGSCIAEIRKRGLDAVIKKVAESGRPLLGICLGMQMLLTKSYEGGEHNGLDIISGEVKKFTCSLKVPHVGFNQIDFVKDSVFGKASSEMYFVHSYYCDVPSNNVLCKTEYGDYFTSGIISGNVVGFQFHPEKSGDAGLKLLADFLQLK